MKTGYLVLVLALSAVEANADSSNIDAAIGGALGGGLGAVIGNEIGGRDGAIIGSAIGGAVGTAFTAYDEPRHYRTRERTYYRNDYHRHEHHRHKHHRHEHHGSHFCPPGQAKKGRC